MKLSSRVKLNPVIDSESQSDSDRDSTLSIVFTLVFNGLTKGLLVEGVEAPLYNNQGV